MAAAGLESFDAPKRIERVADRNTLTVHSLTIVHFPCASVAMRGNGTAALRTTRQDRSPAANVLVSLLVPC